LDNSTRVDALDKEYKSLIDFKNLDWSPNSFLSKSK